jgi:CRISPR/Cas system-associated endoribonuclease Cas2
MIEYFISYDLRDSQDYQKLYDELKRFKAIQVLESLYCLKYQNDKTEELRDHLKKFIDSDDGLIVIKSAFWAGVNLDNNPNNI